MAVVVVSHQLFRKYSALAGRTNSEALKRGCIWPTSPGAVARKYFGLTFNPQLEIVKRILVISVEIFTVQLVRIISFFALMVFQSVF